jgi:hypothetical protein
MRRYLMALTVVAVVFAGRASAQTTPVPAKHDTMSTNTCFRVSDIDNSIQASQTNLNIKTRDHRYFQVQTKGVCFSQPLGMDPYILNVHGSDLICQPVDMDLKGGPRGFVTPCIVDKIVPMSKAQIDALPKKEQP